MRDIEFPEEWGTAPPTTSKCFKSGEIVTFSTLLADGSGLWVMVFEGGHRFARTCSHTGWAIEEQFHGDPKPAEAEQVTDLWGFLISTMVEANHTAKAMGL